VVWNFVFLVWAPGGGDRSRSLALHVGLDSATLVASPVRSAVVSCELPFCRRQGGFALAPGVPASVYE